MSESDTVLDDSKSRFVERVGQMFSNVGMPHLAGRIMGFLLICDPQEQSSEDLQSALGIAASSFSAMTRLLESMYYVERVSVPGSRRRLVRVRRGSWMAVMKDRLRFVEEFREIAEMGLHQCEPLSAGARARLEDVKASSIFVEERFSAAFAEWEKRARNAE